MRYLGRLSGTGMLRIQGEDVGATTYDFDGFMREPAGLTSSGEIRLEASGLKRAFGRRDVQLMTDDGRLLDLSFSEKELRAEDVAHVDVAGELPTSPSLWRR